MTAPEQSTAAERRQWARYLVEERAEGAVYSRLAARKRGEERDILLSLAEAERRHEQHWLEMLGGEPARLPKA
ncbi:MAG: rubrerythrin family protein, partial [Microbacterium sp.]